MVGYIMSKQLVIDIHAFNTFINISLSVSAAFYSM
jgi:hypothetical protein